MGPILAAGHKVSLCDLNVQPFGICAKYDGQNKCLSTVIQECLLEYLFLYMLLVLQAFMEHSSTKVVLPASKKDNGCRKQERRRCRVGVEAQFRLPGGKLEATSELIQGSSKIKSIPSSGSDQRSPDNHWHSTLASVWWRDRLQGH